jgi:hypothetical protein
MKKLFLLALVFTLTAILVLTAFQAPVYGGAGYTADTLCPTVGWNSKVCSSYVATGLEGSTAFLVPPPIRPNVGWNS